MSGSVTFAAPESSGVQNEVVAVPGDAIVFDYRILHRGLANISDQARPLAYFTFAKPWFRDATNYTKTSLFEDDNDSEETFHESSAKLMAAPGISKGELAEGNGVDD
jgi:ectoine hydroxylase-related dioxygenase (phytanoyl-CoA dioxygenase family)